MKSTWSDFLNNASRLMFTVYLVGRPITEGAPIYKFYIS